MLGGDVQSECLACNRTGVLFQSFVRYSLGTSRAHAGETKSKPHARYVDEVKKIHRQHANRFDNFSVQHTAAKTVSLRTVPGNSASRAGKMTSSSWWECTSCATDMEVHADASSRTVDASAIPGFAASASFPSLGIASRNAWRGDRRRRELQRIS